MILNKKYHSSSTTTALCLSLCLCFSLALVKVTARPNAAASAAAGDAIAGATVQLSSADIQKILQPQASTAAPSQAQSSIILMTQQDASNQHTNSGQQVVTLTSPQTTKTPQVQVMANSNDLLTQALAQVNSGHATSILEQEQKHLANAQTKSQIPLMEPAPCDEEIDCEFAAQKAREALGAAAPTGPVVVMSFEQPAAGSRSAAASGDVTQTSSSTFGDAAAAAGESAAAAAAGPSASATTTGNTMIITQPSTDSRDAAASAAAGDALALASVQSQAHAHHHQAPSASAVASPQEVQVQIVSS